MTGVEVKVEGLSKSFGRANIWSDVTLTLPPGEVSVLLGPSGTGKSVFLKSLIGLLKPERGSIVINGVDLVRCSDSELYEIRKLFGVLFQDGALFGSMNLYDNIAFPLREHTKKAESQIRDIVTEKMDMVGLAGDESKLPGEISGGMRKRAGLARALVLDPAIILFDEPDSGLDPVRTAYLNQLIIDLNAQTDATFLIVTHDINTAQTVPDNIGMLYRKHLAMFGPREVLLTSEEPVVAQFLNGRRQGPIGMSEEKDTAQAQREMAEAGDLPGLPPLKDQLEASPGMPDRAAVHRRRERVEGMLGDLPVPAQEAIRRSYETGGQPTREQVTVAAGGLLADESPTRAVPSGSPGARRVPEPTRPVATGPSGADESTRVVRAGSPADDVPTARVAPEDAPTPTERDDRPTDVHPVVPADGPPGDERPTDIRPLAPADGAPAREDDAWTGRAAHGSATPSDPYADPYAEPRPDADPWVADAYVADSSTPTAGSDDASGADATTGEDDADEGRRGRHSFRFWGRRGDGS